MTRDEAKTTFDERGLPAGYAFKPDWEFSPHEFAAMWSGKRDGIVLIDCRTKPEFDISHLDGSMHIPLDELEAWASSIAIEDSDTVAVICHHGIRSLKGAAILRAAGVRQARSIAGGIDLWSRAVDANVPRYDKGNGKVWKV